MLKEQLGREAVKPVTEAVLVPCSGITEGEDPKLELLADPEVFLNATGCLRCVCVGWGSLNASDFIYLCKCSHPYFVPRNVSSAGPNARKSLRDCDGLIDCLVYYVRGTIADYKPDDQVFSIHAGDYFTSTRFPPRSVRRKPQVLFVCRFFFFFGMFLTQNPIRSLERL